MAECKKLSLISMSGDFDKVIAVFTLASGTADVSMLHEVTLGGTGKEARDRHPKVGKGVLIGAGAKILGNIRIGEGSKIASGSVVLHEVPPHSTVAGVPARVVGKPKGQQPAKQMDQYVEFDYCI